jgi:threonine/homoserine/homoserine lactone efflux protein
MPDLSTFAVFAAAALVFLVTPGPAVMFIVARTIERGRSAGLASVAGLGLGTLVHIAAAALGVSAILATSAVAFSAVKFAGAGYLIYLGLRTIFARESRPPEVALKPAGLPTEPASLSLLLRQAAIVNLLNPKTALFFLAFLPQFARPSAGAVVPQIVVLGLCYLVLSLITDGVYVMVTSSIGDWVRMKLGVRSGARRALRYLVGGTYIGLGATAAAAARGAN